MATILIYPIDKLRRHLLQHLVYAPEAGIHSRLPAEVDVAGVFAASEAPDWAVGGGCRISICYIASRGALLGGDGVYGFVLPFGDSEMGWGPLLDGLGRSLLLGRGLRW